MEKLVDMDYRLLENKYKNKKVFLTGHTGFKGSWMLLLLERLGAQVKGFSLEPDESNSHYSLIKGDEKCISIIGDIRNKEFLKREILEFEPDYIFHLAAQALVRESYLRPTDTYETNVLGTAYLLDALRALPNPCNIVIVTTDKVYYNKEWNYPYREQDQLGGYDPYSSSKACVELLVDSYRNSYFNIDDFASHRKHIATARAGNVIGGGDWSKDRLIPDSIKSLKEGEQINLRNPNSVRPWQHVLEPLGAYLLLGAMLGDNPSKYGRAWNFGPFIEDTIKVVELTELCVKQWGSGSINIIKDCNMPHEAGLLKLDISDTIDMLKWKPKYDSTLAIQKTVQWYKELIDYNRVISNKQVEEFLM